MMMIMNARKRRIVKDIKSNCKLFRARKCMDCYSELVKIRSGILKRQTMQGKAGHAYRELAILMQYLD